MPRQAYSSRLSDTRVFAFDELKKNENNLHWFTSYKRPIEVLFKMGLELSCQTEIVDLADGKRKIQQII